jgi:ABC-type transporter MlaC component
LVRRRDNVIAGIIGIVLVVTALMDVNVACAQPTEIAKGAAEPIMKQLEAFRRDDYDAAYVFASTEIKQMFDRPAFERMVKGGYPEIARSTSAVVSRTELGPDGDVFVQLKIRGANGTGIEALYQMVPERDGWKINSVMTRPDSGAI